MRPPTRARHERAFRALLRLYPEWFRRAHGEEMAELFRERLERARGVRGRASLWWRTLGDALANAPSVRSGASRGGGLERGGGGMETVLLDVRHALRRLARAPVFALGAIALLAVGIGANTAVFTLVDALLLRPPPWERPEEVVHVYQDSDDGEPQSSSFPAYRDMAASGVFRAVTAMSDATMAWDGPDGPRQVSVEFTTASYLDVLGLEPSRGRWFEPEHDVVGSAPVAVVSAPAWRSRFGSDPDVVGRTIRLNGQPVTVIGVGPAGLSGTYTPRLTDFWLSISATPVGGSFRVANLERRQDHWYDVRARLAPGVGVDRAQEAMDRLAARLAEEFPDLNRGRDITVFPSGDVRFHPSVDGQMYAVGGLLMAVVVMVLLLASANLANLLLVRGLERTGEMAVRRALGARPGRVARLFLVESLLLSLAGGGLGVLLARQLVAVLPSLPLPLPPMEIGVDWRVGLFSLALMGATGVLFGLAPAVGAARRDLARSLRDDRRTSSLGRGPTRLRGILVAVQVAASLVLVLGAGLLTCSLASLQSVDTGVDAERVAFVRTSFGQAGLSGPEAAVTLEELLGRVAALPGVTRAAATSRLPAEGGGSTTTVVEGYTPAAGTDAVELDFAVVTPGYFEALGIPLLAGRSFSRDDLPGAAPVILVNETAARRFWGGVDVVGRRTRPQDLRDAWRTVIGVVGDAPVGSLAGPTPPMMYFSSTQSGLGAPYVLARTDGEAAALLSRMREEVVATRASLPVTSQGTLASHFASGLAARRAGVVMMGAFSLLAVLLAGLGIYAVVSHGVARRAGELGLRIALGADRSGVVRMVVGEVVATVGIGLLVGAGIVVALAPRLEGVLYGIRPLDPPTFAGAVLFLAAVAGLAAWAPARRAARVDPVEALRTS